jgi:hypothetical protein
MPVMRSDNLNIEVVDACHEVGSLIYRCHQVAAFHPAANRCSKPATNVTVTRGRAQ